jgi:hypothetical protein
MSGKRDKARAMHEEIRLALLREWDPIGIADAQNAKDEYDEYVPTVYKLLIRRAHESEIFDYLWWLETTHMGLCGDRQRTLAFARRLTKIGAESRPER